MHRIAHRSDRSLRFVGLFGVLALTGTLLGCRSTPSTASAPPVPPDTWATVNGVDIKRDAVEKAFRRMQDPGRTLAPEEALTAKLTILNDMIVQEILLAKARDAQLSVTDSELDTAYSEAKKNTSDEAFSQELARRNLSAADMRESVRRDLMVRKMVDREVKEKVAVSDQEVADFFSANRAEFNLEEDAYRVAQIIVTPAPEPQRTNRTGDDATTPQAAKQKVAMLMERLKSGVSFGDLALDYSEDPESAARGGDMGFMPRSALNQVPPVMRDAVLSAEPGNARVVTEGGVYAIVLLVAKEAKGQRELTTPGVKDRIAEQLRARKEELLRAAYLTAVRDDAQVTNHLARRLVDTQGKL